ncbi:hypothetical protein EV175_000760 [Coemansia sp. RSA 1933]|nr:hypothetical protein EV175_000760 [Coemansia sp. RSA 1933]
MDPHLLSSKGAAEEDRTNLWETVLKEVSSSKAVATKNVLILGDSNSGKTGVVTQLLQASLRPQFGNGQDSPPASMSTGLGGLNELVSDVDSSAISLSKHDLALSYSYMDVRDEDNEELISRLGVYQLASDKTTDRELLSFVLDARSFPDTAAVIVLDWSKPWRFVKSLLRWLNVLSRAVDLVKEDTGGREATSQKGPGGWTLGKATVDECRERLERFLQEYSESADPSSATDAASSSDAGKKFGGTKIAAKTADVLLPLGNGVLENNLGIPLIVVCTKSDAMSVIERERGFKEEGFDYIQQILRAVCLRFGAALIYTSTHNPKTFSTLYHYIVHRLLTGPRTTVAAGTDTESMEVDEISEGVDQLAFSHGKSRSRANSAAQRDSGRSRSGSTAGSKAAQQTTAYPFRVRANVVDRDVVFVPAGWDSAAKISFLREPFDVSATQDAWKVDEDRYHEIVDRAIREAAVTSASAENEGCQDEDVVMSSDIDNSSSLLLMFGETVVAPKQWAGGDIDGGSAVAAVTATAAGMANVVIVEDDHTFFERLHEEQEELKAIEGEEASEAAAESRPQMGGSSTKLISELLRNVHNAESSLSTVSDVNNAAGGSILTDDGGDGMDRMMDTGNSMSSFSMQRPPILSSFHSRMDSSENNGGLPTSLGRSAGSRVAPPRQQSQASHDTLAAVDQSPPSASDSLRRKLTATANPNKAAGSKDGVNSNEELTSFFNNLLGLKGGAASSGAGSSTGKSSPQQPARSIGGSLSRASGAGSARDIQAELEHLKAQTRRAKDH